jgi:uncharacterized membrane protein
MIHSKLAKCLAWAAVVCAFVGFLDAAYLTANHLAGKLPPCTIGGGCENVLTSGFAHVGPIPVALIGMAYYLTAALLAVAYLDRQSRKPLLLMLVLSFLGVGVSIVMVYVQLAVLYSVCAYCMVSAFSSFALCTSALWAVIFDRETARQIRLNQRPAMARSN